MKIQNFTKVISALFLSASFSILSADTLLDSQNFNVTLTLAPAHYVTVGDMDFGYINPISISVDQLPLESTTTSVVAYSNSTYGHYVQIVASDPKYLSSDGFSFLMLGQAEGSDDYIAFILNSSYNADGTTATDGIRQILPGEYVINVDGSDENHKAVRDLWASLTNNEQLKTVASDQYLAVLTAKHYSNQ